MIGSMSDFPSIQGEGSLLNLKIDEGKWGGVDREEIGSLITLILSKMSSILRSSIILHTSKKNTDSSAMIHNQLKTHPNFRYIKLWGEKCATVDAQSQGSPSTGHCGTVGKLFSLSVPQFPRL